jgi:16S rRNA (guanine527-N7)-methyltransferase
MDPTDPEPRSEDDADDELGLEAEGAEDEVDIGEDGEGEGESEGEGEAAGAPPGPETAEKPAKVIEDPDAELKWSDFEPASEKELREAMEWAFADEDDVPPALLDSYAKHARMVLEGNLRMNLTAITDAREVAAKHYLDCWRATRLLPLMGRRVLDMGSGAGFPGIPIALAEPNANVHCVDGTRKRTDFMGECIEALEIKNASAEWVRAEEHLLRNKYDIVIMRAISSVRENVRTLRKVRHAMKDVVMLKGPSWSRESRAGEREAERLGFRLDTVWDHELPGEMGTRAILVYRAPGGMGE